MNAKAFLESIQKFGKDLFVTPARIDGAAT
jgi:hypothetical protein